MIPTFKPVADYALLVIFAEEISEAAHASVVALDRAITATPPAGVLETVPALVNLVVTFDPALTDHQAVEDGLRSLIRFLTPQDVVGVQRRVQVCYDTPYAQDLQAVAKATGHAPEAVINAHLAGDYHVLMYGFSPGYAYLSGVPDAIQVPRKPAAVRDIPAGSVIIAGPQCLVTTLTMPTGWSIIGRSPTQILTGDPGRPFLCDVGDRVQFERIDRQTFDRLSKEQINA